MPQIAWRRSVPSSDCSMPAGKTCGNLVERQLPSRHGHDQFVRWVIRRIEVDVVEAIEDDHGKPAQALVAVNQSVVADKRIEQGRCLPIHVDIGLVPVENSAWPMR